MQTAHIAGFAAMCAPSRLPLRPFSFESAYCVHEFILELNLHFDYKTVLDFSDTFSDDL